MVKKISSDELFQKMQTTKEKIMILDVRAEEKYNDYHLGDSTIESINIPKTEIFKLEDEKGISSIPKDREIVVTCTTGNSATKCATILAEYDFDVVVLEGGITAWKEYLKMK